jgi:uncharacterized repeat protein (TIGR02543 family)
MKNKIIRPLVYALLAAALIMGLMTTCAAPEVTIEKASRFTVQFDPDGGVFADNSQELSVIVRRGESLGEQYPQQVTKEGYEFCGWFDGTTRYTVDDPIDSALTLKAKWIPLGVGSPASVTYWTVTFNAADPSAISIASVLVVRGEPLGYKYPQAWRTGFYFRGWFVDPDDATTEYTTTKAITGDITLTAKWETKPTHHVMFDAGDGNKFPAGMEDLGTYGVGKKLVPDPNDKDNVLFILVDGTEPMQAFTIEVFDGDGIYDRLPVQKPLNGDSPAEDPAFYFLVYWLDDENKPYVEAEFIPIIEDVRLTPKWGAPDYSVPLRSGVEFSPSLVSITDQGLPQGSNPVFKVTPGGDPEYTIWNSTENNSTGRWQMMYWINLNLPETFNIRYYNKYSVQAKFYGNVKATATWRKKNFPVNDTMMPAEFYTQNIGDLLTPNRHGYGQISFCINTIGTGEASNDNTIFQQYNLGMGQEGDVGPLNQTWKPMKPGDPLQDPIRPQVLLIQTSDDWIGRIEVTEIRCHNDPDVAAVQI